MKCDECKYSHVNKYGRKSGFSEPSHYPTLECRRYPLQTAPAKSDENPSLIRVVFPIVEDHDWCGEFKQADGEKWSGRGPDKPALHPGRVFREEIGPQD